MITDNHNNFVKIVERNPNTKKKTRGSMNLYHLPELLTPWFQENFQVVFIMKLWEQLNDSQGHSQFGPQGHGWQDFCRGPLTLLHSRHISCYVGTCIMVLEIFLATLDMILSNTGKWITEALIRLHGCTGWSAPLLFANPPGQVFLCRGPIKICWLHGFWRFLKFFLL